jgi:hypothetical protein
MKKFKKLALALSLCVLLIQSHYAADPAVPEEVAEAPRAPVAAHNYLEIAYDIGRYDGIEDRMELFGILNRNSSSSERYRETPFSCFVEEDWRITHDVLQVFYTRHMLIPYMIEELSAERTANSIYYYPKFVMKTIKEGGWQEHSNRRDALFYYWKHAAWIKPKVADQLSRALTEGFEDLIPVNLEWAAYWHQRAAILRAQPQWYKPTGDSQEKQAEKQARK